MRTVYAILGLGAALAEPVSDSSAEAKYRDSREAERKLGIRGGGNPPFSEEKPRRERPREESVADALVEGAADAADALRGEEKRDGS